MINAADKAKWLEELRSGNHRQVKERLKGYTDDGEVGLCCLGVLEEKVFGNEQEIYPMSDDECHIPDERMRTYTILREKLGEVEVSLVSNYNDSGWTFAEIADWIEENVDATT